MTNNIQFICNDAETFEMFPPVPGSKMIPQWYKDTPLELEKHLPYTEEDGTPTVRRCIPVLDYMTGGYIIKNNYEIRFRGKIDEEKYEAFDLKCRHHAGAGAHPWIQAQFEIDEKKKHYLKINQPWLVKTPPGWSCLFYQPHYFFNEEYRILPGIVDTDTHTEPVSLIAVPHKSEFTVLPGDPLVVVFPFKRENWKMELKYELENDAEDRSSFKYYLKGAWHGMYSKFSHSKKIFK